jgi:hypothetical protein
MARTIWKYPFALGDVVGLDMPAGAEVVHVECQGGQPCLWALVDPEAPAEARTFRMFGTGHPIPEDVGPHLGTFQMPPYVWHLFDRPAAEEDDEQKAKRSVARTRAWAGRKLDQRRMRGLD